VSLQRFVHPTQHQLHATGQPIRTLPAARQGPLEVVDRLDQLPSHRTLTAQRSRLNLSGHPLPIVLEVSLSPLCDLEVLVPFLLTAPTQGSKTLLDLPGIGPTRPSGGGRGWG